ncbi:MAG: phytoene desaturase [Betaproteobacteria bacterium]
MNLVEPPAATLAQAEQQHRPQAIVIGSGLGGLAAAIRLGARGYRVTVLEKLDAPGGRAYVHRQDGYTFDAGPTIVTVPHLFEELWTLAGRRLADDVELRAMHPFYTIRFADGSSIDCSADPAQMRAEVERVSPADVAGYERFMRSSKELCRIGFEELGHVPFGSFGDMLRVAPDLLRQQAYRSLYSRVAGFIRDERLRFVFSFHPLFIGGNPFTVTSIYGMIAHVERNWGVHYAMGGTGKLVEGMAKLVGVQGNHILYHAQVEEILVRNGRAAGVRLAGGETIPADIVVSNADAAHTYGTLLGKHPRRRWTDRKLARARYSMSLFVWYFGTKRRYDEVPHHTILVGPRYKGLLDEIFTRKTLASDFSLYLHRPSATDPSVAPPGCDAFYVLSPVPHMDSGIDWQAQAEPYRRKIEAFLARTMLPDLPNQIATSLVTTPLDFRDRLLSAKGAAFGFEPVLWQSAWFRPHNRSEEVQGLYLVGAGTHPGAGVPGVLSSARVLDTVVPHAATFA